MARIPTVTSQGDARSGRISGSLGGQRASAAAFGGQQAQALGAAAGALDDAAAGVFQYQERKRQEDVANRVAQADFTPQELQIRNEVGASGEGYRERTLEAYDAWVDEQANEIDDDKARQEFRTRMANQRNNLSSRSAQYEFGVGATYSNDQANASLSTLGNRLRASPDKYDDLVQQGNDVIANRPGMNSTTKSAMLRSWKEQAASSRFDGMMERATSIQDVQAIRAEMTSKDGKDWTAELSIQEFDRKRAALDQMEKAIQTKADANARAALDSLDGRMEDVMYDVPQEELAAVGKLVEQSANPVTAARYARAMRDSDIKKQDRTKSPAQLRAEAATRANNPRLPVRVNNAITNASRVTGIPASYLAGSVSREYGQYLKGPEDQIDYTKGNAAGASSAKGIGQLLDGTALDIFRSAAFQSATGLNTSSMSDDQVKALRDDPDLAVVGVAIMAKRSNNVIRAATGRNATDAELYMGHFLGEGGLRSLMLGLEADPNASAPALFPDAAKANPTVYKNKDGSDKTLRQLYDELGRTFSRDATGIAYGDDQMRDKVLSSVETGLRDDPVAFAQSVGAITTTDVFSPGGMAQRGQEYLAMADMYALPASESKPFTKDEAAAFKAQLDDSSADEALQLIMSIQEMGRVPAKAAMAQIGEDGNVYAYAGGIALETGQLPAASDVIKGQKRINDNPAIWADVGATKEDMSAAFNAATGAALYDITPAQRQSILDASKAHYIETNTARGKGWDGDQFTASIQAVMGATNGQPAIDTVNGESTILPPGLDGPTMEAALEVMTVADWTALSVQGLPPKYADGTIADPADLAGEASLRAIGGGQYKVATNDGAYLTTGRRTSSGTAEYFLLQPEARAVQAVLSRNEDRAVAATPEEQAVENGDYYIDPDTPLGNGMTDEDLEALRRKYAQ